MRSKAYCIKVPPIAWQRPRLNGGRFFDAQQRDKLAFGLYLAQQHNDEPLFDKPMKISVVFYMPIPKTVNERKLTHYHAKAPDIDNLQKFLYDALKGVVIADDRLICSLVADKIYDKEPRTELVITEVV